MRQSTSNVSPVLGMWQMFNKCELLRLYLIKLKMTSHLIPGIKISHGALEQITVFW